jgi:hypothetical protein
MRSLSRLQTRVVTIAELLREAHYVPADAKYGLATDEARIWLSNEASGFPMREPPVRYRRADKAA